MLAVVVIFLLIVGFLWIGNRRGASAAAKFKAELRAKGEKISFAELGFPKSENVEGLVRLTNAVNRIPNVPFQPGTLLLMEFSGPGRADVSWLSEEVVLNFRSKRITWDELQAHLNRVSDELAEIRQAVERPMRYYYLWDPTNFPNARYPYVAMRTAAQWLAADTVAALHAGDRHRARSNIHALVRLTQLNSEDPTLVAQMIRVAITGLAGNVTWEALQSPKWTEADLTALQKDWEEVELNQALELGILGERAIGDLIFAELRAHGALRTRKRFLVTPTNPPFQARLEALGVALTWNLAPDGDELLMLQHYQGLLECFRDLQKQTPWAVVKIKFQTLDGQLQTKLSGVQGFRHPITSVLIPNFTKACQTVVRNETQRRLTVGALALKRYQLRHERLPAELKDLVPEFLSGEIFDPMSGQPLRYRPNTNGGFSLYSVGEDGKDDHGDANSASPAKTFDLWAGKDAVWPAPEVAPKAP